VKVDPVLLEQDEFWMRGGQEDLAARMAQYLEKSTVSASVELTRDVVQQEDRHPARALAQQFELRGLERQDDGPVLSLRAMMARTNLM
jgi:hypothetical protein